MSLNWSGIFAVMTTPFKSDLSIDDAGLRRNCQFLATAPIDALICLGSEGEFYSLSMDERRRVAEIVVDEISGRKPVICGVSHSSTQEAASLAEHAHAAGADAVMATPPYYVQPSVDTAMEHLVAIAEAAQLPLFVYNAPRHTGYGLSPTDLLSLQRIPGLIGVKQAAPDLTELAEMLASENRRELRVIGGAEGTIWPALCIGAHGNTATAAAAVPEVFAELWRASTAGRIDRGRALYADLEALRKAYRLTGGQAAVVKRLLDLVGLAGGPVRSPTPPAPPTVDPLLQRLLESSRALN